LKKTNINKNNINNHLIKITVMNSLLDKMYIKRFCLPFDTNTEMLKYNDPKIMPCICGHYNHVSCVLKKKGTKIRILSFGMNQMGDTDGLVPGIHAELDAVTKLKPLRQKRLEIIDLLVIRLSKTNNIQSSRPCNNCIEVMTYFPEKKGYKIKTIYYSNNDGDIIKTDLQTLEKEEKHYSRFYRRNNKNKNS
jgi:hypothetical protein